MSNFDKQLKDYEFLVIPTKNIFDMYSDELGCVRVVAGLTEEDDDDETMMLFADDVRVDGKYYMEEKEDE